MAVNEDHLAKGIGIIAFDRKEKKIFFSNS